MINLHELLPLSVMNPCPICGRERATTDHRKLLVTCGNKRCVGAMMGRANAHTYKEGRGQRACPPGSLERNDPRSCRCGAKLSYLVDQWGQASMICDRCHFHADFGRHPMRAA